MGGVAWPIPIAIETKIKAIKALRRNTMINRNKKRIPSEIITNGIGIKIRK